MPTQEVLETITFLPRYLFYGGWLCIGILIIIAIYHSFRCIVKSMQNH